MATGTVFNPPNVNEFDKNKLSKAGKGVYGVCTCGTTTNIDYVISDDVLLAGGSICLVKDAAWGDAVTAQVLNGNTVLIQFLTDWPIDPSQISQNMPMSNYPAKILAGLTFRIIYSSVGSILDPQPKIAIGYNFEKVLV